MYFSAKLRTTRLHLVHTSSSFSGVDSDLHTAVLIFKEEVKEWYKSSNLRVNEICRSVLGESDGNDDKLIRTFLVTGQKSKWSMEHTHMRTQTHMHTCTLLLALTQPDTCSGYRICFL